MLLFNIESIAKKLSIDYELTNHIDHMGVRGSSREDVLKYYIKQLLPERFAVGNGVVTDVNGTQSKQQDFFVYDAFNSPVFLHTESSSIVPVESVYATIEVKSTLKKETLTQSLANIKSVKELDVTILLNSPIVPPVFNSIFGAIFAYTADTTIETIANNLDEFCIDIPHSRRPSVICILDQGVIINIDRQTLNQITIMPSENTTWGIVKNTKEMNLYLFYLLLQQHLNTSKNFPPDLLTYATKSHALDQLQIVIPKGLIPNDANNIGNTGMSSEDLQFITENNQIIYKVLSGSLSDEDLKKAGKSFDEAKSIADRFTKLMNEKFGPNSGKIISNET